jgi:hypothetical protein
MLRKIIFTLIWFPSALILIYVNLYLLNSISTDTSNSADVSIVSPLGDITPYHVAASTSTSQVLGTQINSADARILLLEQFLREHNSPLTPYASTFVEEADRNNIDFRLVVAIAMCESNLGKHIPKDSYNAWGIAVYTGQNSGANFANWEQAISWVSRYMKERYLDRGHDTLRKIGAIYAPPSVNTGHSWSRCVEEFQTGIF